MDDFDNEIKYKLYSKIKDILHPTISKKNISNYKIILEEDLYPIRVFYPNKLFNMNKVIIFIHGDSKDTGCFGLYSKICSDIAINSNSLLLGIDYNIEENYIDKLFISIKYLYDNLINNNIDKDNIILMGDSLGCSICCNICKDIDINKIIMFYPILDNINTYNNSNILLFISKTDKYNNKYIDSYNKLNNNNMCDLVEFAFAEHGFLKNMDEDISKEVYNKINSFI